MNFETWYEDIFGKGTIENPMPYLGLLRLAWEQAQKNCDEMRACKNCHTFPELECECGDYEPED